MFLRVAFLQCLSQDHLAHSNHAAPPYVTELVLKLRPIADPDNRMEVIQELLLVVKIVLLPQQAGRVCPRLKNNLLPVDERARRVFHIVCHVCHQFYDCTLRVIVDFIDALQSFCYRNLDRVILLYLNLLELL